MTKNKKGKKFKIIAAVGAAAVVLFLLLPVIDGSYKPMKQNEKGEAQISTENPLVKIAKRLAALFGLGGAESHASAAAQPGIAQPGTSGGQNSAGGSLAGLKDSAARGALASLPGASGAHSSVYTNNPSNYDKDSLILDADGNWALVKQTKPKVSGRGLYEASAREDLLDAVRKKDAIAGSPASILTPSGEESLLAVNPQRPSAVKKEESGGFLNKVKSIFGIGNRDVSAGEGDKAPGLSPEFTEAMKKMREDSALAKIQAKKDRDFLNSPEGIEIYKQYLEVSAEYIRDELGDKYLQKLQERAKTEKPQDIGLDKVKEYDCAAACLTEGFEEPETITNSRKKIVDVFLDARPMLTPQQRDAISEEWLKRIEERGGMADIVFVFKSKGDKGTLPPQCEKGDCYWISRKEADPLGIEEEMPTLARRLGLESGMKPREYGPVKRLDTPDADFPSGLQLVDEAELDRLIRNNFSDKPQQGGPARPLYYGTESGRTGLKIVGKGVKPFYVIVPDAVKKIQPDYSTVLGTSVDEFVLRANDIKDLPRPPGPHAPKAPAVSGEDGQRLWQTLEEGETEKGLDAMYQTGFESLF